MNSSMNKCALVTGASGGIGREFALLLAADGYDLTVTARNGEALDALAETLRREHGVRVEVCPADLSEPGAPEAVYRFTAEAGMEPDVLVNNAGFGSLGAFHDIPWPTSEAMIRLNVLSLAHLCRLYLPGMIAREQGHILNVASTAAFQPGPLMAVYYATKSFVLSFSEALAEELAGTGVTVNALCPGPTRTGFQARAEVGRAPLFAGKLPSAREVAEYGYRKLFDGTVVAVPGLRNKIGAAAVRFFPRPVVRRLVKKLQQSKKG